MTNKLNTNPALKATLDAKGRDILLGSNCHGIGTIQGFNSALQTVTVTLNYKKIFNKPNENGTTSVELVNYPPMYDCPVIVMQGGNTSLTFPIAVGDECLVCWNDRDMDNWFATGSTSQAPASTRLHAFSDAVALVGLRNSTRPIEAYDTTRALLRYVGGGRVGVGPQKVLIGNASAETLKDLLQELTTEVRDLCTQLQALTVTGVTSGSSASGVPSNAAAILLINTRIAVTATKLGNLLE